MAQIQESLGVPQGETIDQPWREDAVSLPPLPRDNQFVPFRVDGHAGFQHFVDRNSISVSGDGAVRYVQIIRSAQGAETITFEGLHCARRERRIYAYARRGEAAWSPARNSTWMRLSTRDASWTLYREYFCPEQTPIGSDREARDALVRGGFAPGTRSTAP